MGGPLLHWANAVTVVVLADERPADLRRLPELWREDSAENLIEGVPAAITLGGWLGGALQWHFTFMWIFAARGAPLRRRHSSRPATSAPFSSRHATCPASGRWCATTSCSGPSRPRRGSTTPLQKLAYTSTIGFGALSLLTGLVMYKPVQLSALAAVRRLSRRPLCTSWRCAAFWRSFPGICHGGAARLGQLRVDDDRLETSPGVRCRVEVRRWHRGAQGISGSRAGICFTKGAFAVKHQSSPACSWSSSSSAAPSFRTLSRWARAGAIPGTVSGYQNGATANAILLFDRLADGRLLPAGNVATGGKGTGAGLGNQAG